MRVVDLFSGTGSATAAFRDRGHDVEEVEIERGGDVLTWEPEGHYDFIWASPPCQAFSVAAFSRGHHFKDGTPQTETARMGVRLLARTMYLYQKADSTFFIWENPRGLMRRFVPSSIERRTVWYCQYGSKYAKPTDPFGRFPSSFEALTCYNGAKDHESSRRGSNNHGIQGLYGARIRSVVPYGLSMALCRAAEKDLERWP